MQSTYVYIKQFWHHQVINTHRIEYARWIDPCITIIVSVFTCATPLLRNEEIYFQFHSHKYAADVPVKFPSNWKSLNMNLAASILHEMLRQDVRPLSEWKPWIFITPNIEHMARSLLFFSVIWYLLLSGILQGYFSVTGTTLQLSQYKLSNTDEYG